MNKVIYIHTTSEFEYPCIYGLPDPINEFMYSKYKVQVFLYSGAYTGSMPGQNNLKEVAMPADKHPQYQEELERCRYTLEHVDECLKVTAEKKERLDKEVERIKKHFNPHSSQDYLDLTVNSLLQGSSGLKIRNLVTARSKPYFARVDFREKGRDTSEKLYIGKMSLMREDDQQVIIIDWRAPVANLDRKSVV